MRLLLAGLVVASILAAGCDDGPKPEMLAVIAESMLQRDCAPVPLRLVDVPSGDVRLGPSDRWVTFAVSPSGDRVAAVRMDYDLCGPDVPRDEQTATLVMVDVSSQEVTELWTAAELIGKVHWSPDGEHLALVMTSDLVVIEAASGEEVRGDLRDSGQLDVNASRSYLLWPENGRYLIVFIDGANVVGRPRDETLAATTWQFDCPGAGPQPIRLRFDGPTTMVVDHYCAGAQLEPDFFSKTAIDLTDDSVGPRELSPEGEAWVNDTVGWQGAADDGFEGGMLSAAPLSHRSDVTGLVLFETIAWSPSGTELRELPRDEIPEGIDVKTTILIRDADGETIEIPVELEYPMPIFASGPILDVTLLD